MAAKQGDWEDCLQYAAVTDIGMRRDNNQDSNTVALAPDFSAWMERGHVFMVADGMGAHAAGELASKLAVDGVPHVYLKYCHLSPPEALQKSVQETNAEVNRRGQANIDFNNMGTTASVLLLVPAGALVAQVGDSRVYRLRNRKLEQWTFDHSLVWEMRAAGQLPKDEELANTIPKNVITRSLGPYPHVQADIEGPLPLEKGDVFLLCTDGLTGRIVDEELAASLNWYEPAEAAQLFIDLANLRGGPDNITAIVVKVTGDRMQSSSLEQRPLPVAPTPAERSALPIPWIATTVLVLTSLILLILRMSTIAGAVFAAGVACALWGGISWLVRGRGGNSLHQGRRLGRGPYVTTAARSERDTCTMLGSIVSQARESARVAGWEDEPEVLDRLEERVDSALQRSDLREARRLYAQLIRELANRLRSFLARRASDSAIDY